MQAYPGRDPLAEFFRGEVTLRKLRAMVEHLPADSPARWHDTGGRPYTIGDQLAWRNLWATWQVQVLLARGLGLNKKAKMPADEMPAFPWERGTSADSQTLGSVDDDRKEEALDYLLALE